jgi:ribose transport system ATP-binding protein
VEIAKAISQNARILVMDEPTAALSDRETELLFALIARLKADGVAIVYISHRMAEVFALGERITVLRDGRRVGSVRPADVTADQLVRMMVGRTVDMTYPRHFAEQPGEILLTVKGLSAPNGISDIDIEVRQGEIVGLCGLVGSGRSEVARAIFGADPVSSGQIMFDGKPMTGKPDAAARRGIALIPESRKSEGLALLRSVGDNLVVSALHKLFPRGLFDPRGAQRSADSLIRQLRIATPGARQTVGLLSGGNQQKVVIGKWLAAGAKLFIFDEPTRGIDVGAKSEIFALIDRLVAEGAAALMISSDQIEICHVCDRAYVMREGRIAGHLARKELTEENIVRLGMHDA